LFVSRAAEARPGFVLTDDNTSAVAAVCQRLDGIPLALELAAARVASMGPAELAERLDQRFRLLTRGSRTARARHQTLRAAIDWSFDMLDSAAQRGLASCAVFAGGFTLGAAEAVLADDQLDPLDVADVVDELVRRSLIVVEQDGAGATRYRLLETIRQYGEEHLDPEQVERARRAHSAWCVQFAEQAGAGLRGVDEVSWLDRLEPELENLRLAVTNAA
jgi:predicted ATPase